LKPAIRQGSETGLRQLPPPIPDNFSRACPAFDRLAHYGSIIER